MDKKKFIIATFAVCILTFFYRIFFSIISIDTEVFINNRQELINSWYGINRYSLGIIKMLTNKIPFNIIATNIISLLILLLALYIFAKGIIKEKNNYINKMIFILIIITSPLIAEQFVFTLQIFEISIGYLLLSIIFHLINKYIYCSNKKSYLFIIIILLSFVFGIYQAFCQLYITLSVLYFIVMQKEKNFSYKESIIIGLKYFLILIISLFLSQIIAILIKNYLNISVSSYLSNQIGWTKYGIKSILYIGYYFLNVLFSMKIYYNIGYLIIIILTFIHIKKNFNKKNMILNIALVLLLITPFSMSIAFGNMTVARSQFSLPFVIGFIIILYNKKGKYYYLLPLLIISIQIVTTFTLYKNDYLRYIDDTNVMNDINSVIVNYRKYPVVFIGEYNNEIKIKGDVLGESFYNWDKETINGSNNRIHGFFLAHGINYVVPTTEQISMARQNINKYDGKITIDDNIIIINLYKY